MVLSAATVSLTVAVWLKALSLSLSSFSHDSLRNERGGGQTPSLMIVWILPSATQGVRSAEQY